MEVTNYNNKPKAINPWQWQEKFGFVQANDISGHQRVIVCSGQSSVDDEGKPVHEGNMGAQIAQALDNLETVLKNAGLNLSNVVRLNYYTTDVDVFFSAYDVVMNRLKQADCKPVSTLLGVTRLAFPELMIEIEATAMSWEGK